MAPQKPSDPSTVSTNPKTIGSNSGITKRSYNKRGSAPLGIRHKDGLLKAVIHTRSTAMEM
jgi:hypothetical protein